MENESEQSVTKKASYKTVLRWMAVLPVFILGLIIGPVLVNIFFTISDWFIGVNPDSGWSKIMFWGVSSGIGAAIAVYYGTRVAPSHRKIVSAVLAAMVVIVSVLFLLVGINIGEEFVGWYILTFVAMIFGGGYIMYQFFEEGDDHSLFD